MFDPYVAILDAKRFELALSDDAALVWQDGFASVVAPEDGKYIIQVRESAYAGNGACLYRLHVGNFPRPTAVVPAGGKLGETVDVRWIGDVLGRDARPRSRCRPASERDFGLCAQDEQGDRPLSQRVPPQPFGNVIEAEPNDDQAARHAVHGADGPQRRDRQAGRRRPVRLQGQEGPGLRHPRATPAASARRSTPVHVPRQEGRRRDRPATTTRSAPDSYFRFSAPDDGRVRHLADRPARQGGPDYAYRIEVTPVEPQLDAERRRRADLQLRDRRDRRRRSQGEPAGDPGQRHSRRLRRRAERSSARRPARRA